jgi:hypothetical protein
MSSNPMMMRERTSRRCAELAAQPLPPGQRQRQTDMASRPAEVMVWQLLLTWIWSVSVKTATKPATLADNAVRRPNSSPENLPFRTPQLELPPPPASPNTVFPHVNSQPSSHRHRRRILCKHQPSHAQPREKAYSPASMTCVRKDCQLFPLDQPSPGSWTRRILVSEMSMGKL